MGSKCLHERSADGRSCFDCGWLFIRSAEPPPEVPSCEACWPEGKHCTHFGQSPPEVRHPVPGVTETIYHVPDIVMHGEIPPYTPEVPAPAGEVSVWLIEDKSGNPIRFATEMPYHLMVAMGWSVVRYVRAR